MTEPDEAQRAFRKWAPKWTPTLADAFAAGHFDTSASGVCFSEGYRAGAAASAERIKALEARVAELERRLNGGAGCAPVGPYDLPQMRAYFVGTPPIAKISDQ